MYYTSIRYGQLTIEFLNSMSGEETVKVNGDVVSEKYSLFGTAHHFHREENGRRANYVVESRVKGFQIVIDFSKNGEYIVIGQKVGRKPRPKTNVSNRQKGIKFMEEYDLEMAEKKFRKALEKLPDDAELHFLLACIYSVEERNEACFEQLNQAIQFGLADKKRILEHDFLAYIRVQPEFEDFRREHLTV